MTFKKQSLGKGLNALLTSSLDNARVEDSPKNAPKEPIGENVSRNSLLNIALNKIEPGKYQPRRDILNADLETLADSVRREGVLQPIVVRPLNSDQYEIIAGERRWRAAQLAGLTDIPAVIKNVSSETALAIGIIENIQREDLSPLDEALAYDRLAKEFHLTHIQVAEAVGKSRTTITNALRLLNLTDEVKLLLEKGEIEVGHAKVLLTLRGHQQNQIAKSIVARGLSVRETEKLVFRFQQEDSEELHHSHHRKHVDPDIQRLENSLSDKLGAPVKIAHSQQGKGKLVIHYNSLDELEGVLAHLQHSD